ncbi:uncharacterized protein [Miscanthus floridulus]|uniref:uncharacterized protein n=1 Tax=Miscanthus floridulus TaxID=154761 RepID=UPI00345B0995
MSQHTQEQHAVAWPCGHLADNLKEEGHWYMGSKTGSEKVEIYLEKVRDLLDLSKDNLQIKKSKTQGIYISGATEVRMKDMAPSFHSNFL